MSPTSIDPSQILGYARVSTQRQFTVGHGLERYIEQLKNYGIPEENIFWDVESGGSDSRKGYQTILDLIRTGHYKRIVIPLFERFGRSLMTLEQARKELVELGIELVVLADGDRAQDLDTPDGILSFQFKSVMAEYGRNYNRFQSIQGHKAHRKKLKAYLPSFGYEINDDAKLIPNHKKYKQTNKTYWEVARELYELFLENGSASGTIREFTLRYGYERAGHRHHDWPRDWSSLRHWLLNPVLRGYVVYFPKNPQKRMEIPNQHEPLITETEYFQAKSFLGNRASRSGKSGMPINILSGIAICDHCGSGLYSKSSASGKNTVNYLVCRSAYPKAGKKQACNRRSSYGLKVPDAIKIVIDELIKHAETLSQWAESATQNNDVPPEVQELDLQIRKLEALNDEDLAEILEVKRTKLRQLINASREGQVLDKVRHEKFVNLLSDKELWKVHRTDLLKPVFAELVKEVRFDKGKLMSIQFHI